MGLAHERFAAGAELGEVCSRYERTLRAWSRVAGQLEDEAGAVNANALFDEQRAYANRLRVDVGGREFIESLLGDDDHGVKLMAAAEALAWSEAEARDALASVAGDDAAPPAHAFSAEMTLREFDAGRLPFDY